MTILNRKIFPDAGPYIEFCIADVPYESTWESGYIETVFYEMPDNLLGTYCSLTRSYACFDQYEFTQLTSYYDIYLLVADLLLWEYQLAKAPVNYFHEEAAFWAKCHSSLDGRVYSAAEFKADLIETLHFLIGNLNQAAATNRCLIIAGF